MVFESTLLEFPPDHFIYDAGIALNDFDDFC